MNAIKPYKNRSPIEKEAARRRAVARLAAGATPSEVARDYGVSRQAVHEWRKAAADPARGLAPRPQGRQCKLDADQLKRLRLMLLEGAAAHGFATDLWTIERVRQLVRKEFGVEYGERSVWFVLRHYLDFSPQKPERRAREADPAKVAAWKRQFARRGKKGAA
jgi:transposase